MNESEATERALVPAVRQSTQIGTSCWVAAAAVFLIAVALRVPSCFESFWVDELHSAWTIWGEFGDVFSRARIGNQTPFYFVGLWCWKNTIGESEVALRMTSVLATALAASIVTIGITRWSKCLVGGTAAGMVLAAETNAIFYGTELRPFACLILASTIAGLGFLRLVSRPDANGDRTWFAFVLVMLAASLLQPTSLGVLIWLFVGLVGFRMAAVDFGPRISIAGALLATAVLAVGWTLWQTTLASSWRARSNWATFAKAPQWHDAANLWDWWWLWLVPVVLIFVPHGGCLPNRYSSRQKTALALISGACVLTTVSFWGVSRLDWVHLWHRRYAISLLPLFAILMGAAVSRFENPNLRIQFPAIGIAAVLLFGLMNSQDVLRTALTRPDRLAYRGEDWRGAVQWLNDNATTSDRVFIDSGLIEASARQYRWYRDEYSPRTEYLQYPVMGPYQTFLVRPFASVGGLGDVFRYLRFKRQSYIVRVDPFPDRQHRIFLLVRRPARQINVSKLVSGARISTKDVAVEAFGGVSVLTVSPLPEDIADGL